MPMPRKYRSRIQLLKACARRYAEAELGKHSRLFNPVSDPELFAAWPAAKSAPTCFWVIPGGSGNLVRGEKS